MSANNSYSRSQEDLAILMGIDVSHSTHQRLVHRQEFNGMISETPVESMSLDGGKARIRTPKGEVSVYNDYKAVVLDGQGIGGYFQKNEALVDWINRQPFAPTVSCLGDGHDGIWNIFRAVAVPEQRREILDWYHLVENLHKVGGSIHHLNQVEALLWTGKVEAAIALFSDCTLDTVPNFVSYLTQHRSRIPNYDYLKSEGLTIGSGGVESGIKQISRRVKISGAQWEAKNVDQVVKHRCADLNGQFSTRFQLSKTI